MGRLHSFSGTVAADEKHPSEGHCAHRKLCAQELEFARLLIGLHHARVHLTLEGVAGSSERQIAL